MKRRLTLAALVALRLHDELGVHRHHLVQLAIVHQGINVFHRFVFGDVINRDAQDINTLH